MAVGWGHVLLKEEGDCKKHPTSARQVPRQNQKGGREEHSRSGICSLLFPCGPRRGTGDISFSPLSAFPSSSPRPPTLFFLRWLYLYSFFPMSLWFLSTSVPSALSLRLPGILLSSPKPETPLSLRPQHPGLVCVHVALSWSAFSHVSVREFPSALHPLPQLPTPAPSRPPVWVGRGPWSERASACLSVCLPAG